MAVFHGFGGFLLGFVLPVAGGLYSCSENDLKLTDYWLRVLFYWLLVNQLLSPVLKLVFNTVSPSFWSLVYTAFPVLLFVPKSNVLKQLDDFTLSFLKMGHHIKVKAKLEEACVFSRKLLSNIYNKLQGFTNFNKQP